MPMSKLKRILRDTFIMGAALVAPTFFSPEKADAQTKCDVHSRSYTVERGHDVRPFDAYVKEEDAYRQIGVMRIPRSGDDLRRVHQRGSTYQVDWQGAVILQGNALVQPEVGTELYLVPQQRGDTVQGRTTSTTINGRNAYKFTVHNRPKSFFLVNDCGGSTPAYVISGGQTIEREVEVVDVPVGVERNPQVVLNLADLCDVHVTCKEEPTDNQGEAYSPNSVNLSLEGGVLAGSRDINQFTTTNTNSQGDIGGWYTQTEGSWWGGRSRGRAAIRYENSVERWNEHRMNVDKVSLTGKTDLRIIGPVGGNVGGSYTEIDQSSQLGMGASRTTSTMEGGLSYFTPHATFSVSGGHMELTDRSKGTIQFVDRFTGPVYSANIDMNWQGEGGFFVNGQAGASRANLSHKIDPSTIDRTTGHLRVEAGQNVTSSVGLYLTGGVHYSQDKFDTDLTSQMSNTYTVSGGAGVRFSF